MVLGLFFWRGLVEKHKELGISTCLVRNQKDYVIYTSVIFFETKYT